MKYLVQSEGFSINLILTSTVKLWQILKTRKFLSSQMWLSNMSFEYEMKVSFFRKNIKWIVLD